MQIEVDIRKKPRRADLASDAQRGTVRLELVRGVLDAARRGELPQELAHTLNICREHGAEVDERASAEVLTVVLVAEA